MTIRTEDIQALEDQIDTAGLEASMNFRLSDLIREGSTVTEQCIGNWNDAQGRTCALSAAYLAAKARHLL